VALTVQDRDGPDGVSAAVHGAVRLADQGGDLQAGCEVESARRGDVIEQLNLKLIIIVPICENVFSFF
jgi:hypothetical protein